MARVKLSNKVQRQGQLFARKIKSERLRKNMSQRELSGLADVPLDTVRSIENERISIPGVFAANNLVKALGGNLNKWLNEISGEVE